MKHKGLVQARGIESLVDAVPRQGRRPPARIDSHRRLGRSAEASQRAPAGPRQQHSARAGREQDLTFGEWSDFYLENFSRPPFRAQKTHEVNQRALKHLRKMFESTKLAELTADNIEMYLRKQLQQRAPVKTKAGFVEKQVLKATTVHQELRVLGRMLNVAVRKKFLLRIHARRRVPGAGRWAVRPHYVMWSEQQKIEFAAPEYLRNVIRIVTETGLRIYKELTPDEEGSARSGEPDGVDSGLEDAQRSRRGSLDEHRGCCLHEAVCDLRVGRVPFPER